MKRLLPLFLVSWIFCAVLTPTIATAQNQEDTIEVQTFTYGSDLRGWFAFPSDTNTYRKIWLYYKLKCDQGTTADQFPCGEWDYLTYTFLYDHTGKMDSNQFFQPSFEVNGASPDSFYYSTDPSWRVDSRSEIHPVYEDTNALVTGTIGQGSSGINIPFNTNSADGKSYLLWTADELTNAGLQAGDLTGLQLDVTGTGSAMRNLTISLAPTSIDSLAGNNPPEANFQEVYARNTSLPTTGWQPFAFEESFQWDGTSNVLMAISFDNREEGNNNTVNATPGNKGKNLVVGSANQYLFFQGKDFVTVPAAALSPLDDQITVSCWVKGNSAYQPQSNYLFEAEDSSGERVLNVHLPWNNSRIYWDAGRDGSGMDRIEKVAAPEEMAGEWIHWAFTKDANSGEMKIYKNGQVWHQGTGHNRPMNGIATMILGANTDGSDSYDGSLDEFAIWDTVLGEAAIQQMGHQKLANQSMAPDRLLLYYPFDQDNYPVTSDQSGNGHDGQMFGLPGLRDVSGHERFLGFQSTGFRPNITFEQGDFITTYDTIYVTDTIPADPLSLVRFDDPNDPEIPSDTQMVWPAAYDFLLNANGQVIDSTLLGSNKIIYRTDQPYYGPPFEIVDRYELLRYITPYGIGLDLGPQGDGEGFTWKIDVTDFAPLLADSVELSAGNNQEFLDMKFVMIKGTPPREVKRIENVYSGSHQYNAAIETNFLTPKTFTTTPEEKMARLRITNTGHGFGGNENCAEFCAKTHRVKVDGVKRYDQYLWRDNCAMNPVYPQGGTWIYNRSNWCPGAEVDVDKYDLTHFYDPGDDITIDYDMEPYTWNGQGSTPYWRIEAQLVTYGNPNFERDAEMDMIIAPNEWAYYKRFNPVCSNPVVRIKNSGSEVLTSATIEYGVEGGTMHSYEWTGNLALSETQEITLPLANFGNFEEGASFVARITQPNGGIDEHPVNNEMRTDFNPVPEYPESLIVWLKTNNAGGETYYEVVDPEGKVIHKRDNMLPNTLYKDTLNFDPGCYRFTLYDRGHNGLSFFANNDGNGYMTFRNGAVVLRSFDPNFGSQISQSFTVGYAMNTGEPTAQETWEVYPNPSDGMIHLVTQDAFAENATIKVVNATGKVVWMDQWTAADHSHRKIDLAPFGKGVYLVQITTANGTSTKRIVVQ